MVLTWQPIISTIIMIALYGKLTASPNDWRAIELLAEEHPYIVALLNGAKDYTCTGTIISKLCILTSGSCVNPAPKHIAVGAAVFSKKTNNNTIFDVASTKLHIDYTFEMKTVEPNVTRIHSNIGLVIVVRPDLGLFIPTADIGHYYASELIEMELTVVGYGKISDSHAVVLQHQAYQQAPCTNPKWYYCVCGVEHSTDTSTYQKEFGNGAPVLLGTQVVGVTASPCGTLSLKSLGIKYNIFTVIGPYLPWIEKADANSTLILRARNNADDNNQEGILFHFVYTSLVISKVFN